MTTPLIDLPTAKAQLGIKSDTSDAQITKAILAATELVNVECGVSITETFTETLTGNPDQYGRFMFVATYVPLVSITSITGQLDTRATTGALVSNPDAGTFYAPVGSWINGPQTVVYTAGRGPDATTVPDALAYACAVIVQWLWRNQRSASLPTQGGSEMSDEEGWIGFPQEAVNAMRPYKLGPRL